MARLFAASGGSVMFRTDRRRGAALATFMVLAAAAVGAKNVTYHTENRGGKSYGGLRLI